MKIDLHVHIKRTSRCAKEEIDVMAQSALSKGLNGIVVFDHNYQSTAEECMKYSTKEIKVFRGIEMNVMDEDVVIISSHNIDFAPKYKEKITDLKMLQDWIEKTESLLILAHPYRRHDITIDFNILKPHAVEIASRHIIRENREKIHVLSKKYRMNCVSVSDAHKSNQLGGFCIDTDYDVNNEEELINCVKNGRFTLMESSLFPIATYARNIYL